jgi:hypothetical protein
MVAITWRRTIIGGNNAVNKTFQFNTVFKAFERVAAYKDVIWKQVESGGAQLTIACVGYNIGSNVLLWTNGKTIYVPANVNWGSWRIGMIGAMAHELGHAYGSTQHNTIDAGLMRAGLFDAGQNFTPGDFRGWFTQLPARRGIKNPWDEPNRWRAITMDGAIGRPAHLEGYEFGHPSLYRRFIHATESHKNAWVSNYDNE